MFPKSNVVVVLFTLALTCAVAQRDRTVRRDFTAEDDEEQAIAAFTTFLDESEGTDGQQYWPADANPLEDFGLLHPIRLSDLILQVCMMSGVYVPRAKGGKNNSTQNATETSDSTSTSTTTAAPARKKSFSYSENRQVKKWEAEREILQRLLGVLESKKDKRSEETTTPPSTISPPEEENWEEEPYDVLAEAENQFNNLCYTLIELRRLNRKLARQATGSPPPTTAPSTEPTTAYP